MLMVLSKEIGSRRMSRASLSDWLMRIWSKKDQGVSWLSFTRNALANIYETRHFLVHNKEILLSNLIQYTHRIDTTSNQGTYICVYLADAPVWWCLSLTQPFHWLLECFPSINLRFKSSMSARRGCFCFLRFPSQNRLVIINYVYYVKIWLHDTSRQSHLHLIPSYLDVTGRSLDSIAIAVGSNWYIEALVQLKVIENLHVRSKDQLKWYQMFTWHQIRHWFH